MSQSTFERANTRAGQVILNKMITVDDFGTAVYRCHFTKEIVYADNCRLVGPFMTSVNGTNVCHPDSKYAERTSRAQYDKTEGNCNSCKHIQRIKHDKHPNGFVNVKCEKVIAFYNPRSIQRIYNIVGDEFWIHPSDPMGVPCWESRVQELLA